MNFITTADMLGADGLIMGFLVQVSMKEDGMIRIN